MLQHIFLESRVLLFSVWIAVQLVLIGIWSWRRTRAANRAVWIGLVALPTLMLVSTVVHTGREKLMALCRTLAGQVERGEAGPIEARLADDFNAAGLDRDAFAERLESAMERYGIGNVGLSRFEIEFDGSDRATVEVTASCHIRTADRFLSQVLSRWRVVFTRDQGEWRIITIEAVPTPLSPIRNLRDWIR